MKKSGGEELVRDLLTGPFGCLRNAPGMLEGNVTSSLSISGELQPNAMDMTKVERKPESTKITGTAASDYGTYDVNVTQ